MGSQIFLDNIGVEPLGYIGFIKDSVSIESAIHNLYTSETNLEYVADNVNSKHSLLSATLLLLSVIEVDSNIHTLLADDCLISLNSDIDSTVHKQYSTDVSISYNLDIGSTIHRLLYYNKINAPVKINCNRYLNTGYEETYLHTPQINCDS